MSDRRPSEAPLALASGRVADGRDGGAGRRWWLIGGVLALQIIIVVAIAAVMLMRGDVSSGLQLRAETLVPGEMSVRPSALTCPADSSPSPVSFRDVSALADSLPLYDGDLIVVRVRAIPTGAASEAVEFSAQWPSTVIGSAGPICAYVLGPDETAKVEWGSGASGGTDFRLTGVQPGRATEVEVWLVADEPVPRSAFRTSITTAYRDDDVVIDPVGGRVQVEARASSVPQLDVEATRLDEQRFAVVAEISNPTPTTRSLDLELRLGASGDPTWTIADPSSPCETRGEVLECSIGDLNAGASASIEAEFRSREGWTPTAVACTNPPADIGFGVCVEGTVVSLGADFEVGKSDLVPLERPATQALTIRTNPDEVVGRVGTTTKFDFELASAPGTDLGSVVIVGSDCETIARTLQPLDDGDAFLESDEVWVYPCEFDTDDDAVFRLDAAAVDANGDRVTASYDGTVRVIDPELTVEGPPTSDAEPVFAVLNTGTGVVTDVAISVPGCTTFSLKAGDPSRLDEGESVEFICSSGNPRATGVIALGVDELGLGVVGGLG